MPLHALALETTSRRAQVALVREGQILAEDAFQADLKHTAHLLPLIDALCRSKGVAPADIQETYVSTGPGGFTGTRIGVTFAKSMALARAVRLVSVPTARVLVENAPREADRALVVIDARRGRAWVQSFQRRAADWQSEDPSLVTTLHEALAAAGRPIWLVGEGVSYHAQAIDPRDAHLHVVADAQPRASVVAALGWKMARGGCFADPFELVPTYVRLPEAEEKRLGLE
jgi:tRNA threonylcarbamoyladenosine biosynthesis protein TsaB